MGKFSRNLIWLVSAFLVLIMSVTFRPDSESFLGVVQSTDRVLSSGASGIIKEIHVKSGQAVKKGQVLIELSDVNLQITINEAKFNLRKTQLEKNFAQRLNAGEDQPAAQDLSISQFENDLRLRMKQQESLKILALEDGTIGDISVSVGEMVQAYQPLAIFYSPKVQRIRGYLHETAQVALKRGDKVRIQSAVDYQKESEAEILSVGERYIEFPLRLKTSLNSGELTWAREVEILLPDSNSFLPMEKVKITRSFGEGFFTSLSSSLKQRSGL